MCPSILVTGATGPVGGFLIQELLTRCIPVRVLGDMPDLGRMGQRTSLVEAVAADVDDADAVDAALSGIDHVFLWFPPAPDQVARHGAVIEAVERTGRPIHLVTLSSMGMVPSSVRLQMTQWQTVTEAQIRSAELPATILRPQVLMQTLFYAAPSIRADHLFSGAFDRARLPFLDARDLAAVAATVLTTSDHEGNTYVLTGPQALSCREIAATLSGVLGRTIEYVDMPPDAYHEHLVGEGVPHWIADDVTMLARAIRMGYVGEVTSVVTELLGRPSRTFQQFLEESAEAFQVPDQSPCSPL